MTLKTYDIEARCNYLAKLVDRYAEQDPELVTIFEWLEDEAAKQRAHSDAIARARRRIRNAA